MLRKFDDSEYALLLANVSNSIVVDTSALVRSNILRIFVLIFVKLLVTKSCRLRLLMVIQKFYYKDDESCVQFDN